MTSFKENLNKSFTSKRLSADQINSLMSARPKKSYRSKFIGAAIAACILFAFFMNTSILSNKSIPMEIAINHLKASPSMINTQSIKLINQSLSKLNFKVINSKRLAGYKVLGARYCTVQGERAAQIKLSNSKGELFTLYQYKAVKKTADKNLRTVVEKGDRSVEVSIWKEGEINLGLARTVQ